ncbi:MAG: tRNA uridine(34) 5-carboxymethylaminomethyl modification radical SAM/GNAT enzyme Elp3 [Patescibacteria group bacterium]|nr:tRNA uridine(34) 5-carboxymethylaminomethyl modification radical SAM/GNAT enzyme Elp3 [Patescibacteria group bacterium]
MDKLFSTIIKETIRRKCKSPEDFDELKKEICGWFGVTTPRNADIRDYYEKRFDLEEFPKGSTLRNSESLALGRKRSNLDRKIEPWKGIEKLLKSKKIRTLSGVAVVAVLTKFYPCRGKCLYCPTESKMPKSYLSNEPAVMRAITVKFNPYDQVQKRLRALEINGHDIDKIELIVMGGTFSDLPKKYQYQFIKECYRAANDYPNNRRGLISTLADEQKRNEKAGHRIIGLTLETRPDALDEKEIKFYRELGATRVEIGVQSIYDDVLMKNKRGHTVEQTITATKLLKDAGFKVSYHMMPGLLGSSPKKDLAMFKEIFTNPDFQPDLIKIYPCVVTKNSALYKLWKKNKYKALNNKQAEKLIYEIKKIVPLYVRISRLIRDIPTTSIVAGPNISNLRQIVQNKGVECSCIRCREVRENCMTKDKMVLRRIDYNASGEKEIYLEYSSPDGKKLYSMLRLRIQKQTFNIRVPLTLNVDAVIREVHTYGKLLSIGKRDKKSPQHAGLGKKLIAEAERIAKKEFGCQKISVIAGIGVREYYRKLGYKLQNTYMIKKI